MPCTYNHYFPGVGGDEVPEVVDNGAGEDPPEDESELIPTESVGPSVLVPWKEFLIGLGVEERNETEGRK